MNFLPEMKKNDFVFPSHMTYSVLQLELLNMVPKAFLIRYRVSIPYFLEFSYCARLKVRTISNLVVKSGDFEILIKLEENSPTNTTSKDCCNILDC